MADPFDPYKILQVDPEAEIDVIRAAYRGLARKYHPDKITGAEAAARMTAINAAWEILGDPVSRRRYDDERADRRGTRAATAGGGATAGGATTASGAPSPEPGPPLRPDPGLRRPPREPENVSRDWTSGRSSVGGGFDESMHAPDGLGAAGPPPGRPSGSVLNFGRYAGWSLGEISRQDIEFIEWLDRTPIGRPYRDEIDVILRRVGRRRSAEAESSDRRGLFRRR
jgi:curved DNA-binding protein CbpA